MSKEIRNWLLQMDAQIVAATTFRHPMTDDYYFWLPFKEFQNTKYS